MSQSRPALDQGIERYQALIQHTPELHAEFESSLPQFFKAGLPNLETPLEALASARRHLEWFLFERHSATLLNRPADGLLERWQEAFPEREPGLEASLLRSFAGLFEVVEVLPEVGLRVVDLSGLHVYELSVEDGQFELGDLLVGRLHPIGEDLYVPSTACASFRDERLLSAVKRDVESIREARERKVFHIAQEELESMFFGGGTQQSEPPAAVTPPVGAVSAARDWLTGGGLAPDLIEAVLLDLKEHAPDPENIHPGRGDALGHWLDELAFSSRLNLEEARGKLLAAWLELHAPRPAEDQSVTPASRGDEDVREAMAAFERDCASGKSVSTALGDLERKLALDLDETGDVGTVPDFPGVVGAMVEEFLWEEESEHGADSVAGFEVLHVFSRYSENLGVFEELSSKDIADFATRWIPENHDAVASNQVATLLKALAKFTTWAHETQGALALADTATLVHDLQGTLERITVINSRMSDECKGDLYEVCELDSEKVHVSHFETGDARQIAFTPAIERLKVGDFVRAADSNGTLTPVRTYPQQLGTLLTDLAGT